MAGTGEGGVKGGQEAARALATEVKAAEAGRKGGVRGEAEATRPRAETFNPAERDRLGRSVVADILEVSGEQAEGTRGMAVAGGQRQPVAPNVPAVAMKLILSALQRKEKGRGT